MTANDSKSDLLINTIIPTIILLIKKPVNADYSALTEKIEWILKLLSLKLMIESDVSSIRIFLVKLTLKIGQNKHLLLVLFWNLILGFIKLKI